ncbi:MAG: PSD1 and planctomycete cytochrome C domain-containing protein [Pirellulaceae bacterium]
MFHCSLRCLAAIVTIGMVAALSVSRLVAEDDIDFSRDIRPLLTDRCFHCHGPDEGSREADLRLDTRAGLFGLEEMGGTVHAGDSDASELYRRIASEDEFERMPPEESGNRLTADEIELIRRWIDAGASWEEHWAFEPPRAAEPPMSKFDPDMEHPIDRLIHARLVEAGLEPAPPAARETLIRRLSLDLTGLPPTIAEVERFIQDDDPRAYERIVDRLLSSSRYGEHQAVRWLDLARYADTNGYERDHVREIWPWRDWVIAALNADMPFDRFTLEQLAGDLLPNPTEQQLVATGFHRNSPLNRENGIDIEEYRVEAVADRVNTTGTVWLGLTLGCARCHDHKYDPISQVDYFRMFAIFNQDADELAPSTGNDVSYRRDISPRLELRNVTRPDGSPSTTLVMRGAKNPRVTRLHQRGNFLTPGEEVTPGTPAKFTPLPVDAPADRLALARWLVDGEHPLTARVVMNRLWMHYFGRGLVSTLDDFGLQSAAPTHPALLDWLAVEFVRRDWSVKAMHRLIVTSETYRQQSARTPELERLDPNNTLLSVFPRRRLSAEQVRDNALSISGILHEKLGGPGVFPYQPPTNAARNRKRWDGGSEEDRRRRAIYTFWERTAPYVSFQTFDAPTREVCVAQRTVTGSPLQALDLMNHPTYVEAARALGKSLATHAGDLDARLALGLRKCVGRHATEEELTILRRLFHDSLANFRQDEAAAHAWISQSSEATSRARVEPSELAAWTLVANTLLNLDETITRE